MMLEIMPKVITDKKRSGNMYINEENKGEVRREVIEYDASKDEKFPPVKKPLVDCNWAFKLEGMTSNFKTPGEDFEWKLPRKYI